MNNSLRALTLLLFVFSCSSSSDNIQLVLTSSCVDGVQNGTETGVDCGGECEPCATCEDGIQNGNETGIDCGSDCDDCIPTLDIPESGFNAETSYSGYNLVWNDEFDGNTLDHSKWGYHLGSGCPNLCYWGNNELQYFTDSDSNIYFESGNLIIEAKTENIEGHKYSSARLHTDDIFEFKYGRVDIRAAMPDAAGTWTALFMLNKDYTINNPAASWPSGGEIDVVEYLGEDHNDILGTPHYGADLSNHQYNSKHYKSQNGEAFNEAFYVYSIIWEEGKITWLVNDVEYHSITPDVTSAVGQPYPFNDEFYFVLALSVGGNLTNVNPLPEEFPAFLIIDYIRVYQK